MKFPTYEKRDKLLAEDSSQDTWKTLRDMTKKEQNSLKNYYIIFSLEDIIKFFEDFDREWFQVNFKEMIGCESYEGVDYEPGYIGKIIPKKKLEKLE